MTRLAFLHHVITIISSVRISLFQLFESINMICIMYRNLLCFAVFFCVHFIISLICEISYWYWNIIDWLIDWLIIDTDMLCYDWANTSIHEISWNFSKKQSFLFALCVRFGSSMLYGHRSLGITYKLY